VDIETLHVHVYYLNLLFEPYVLCTWLLFELYVLCIWLTMSYVCGQIFVIFCGLNMCVKSYISISSNYSVNG
jgi:hypothetical protein